MLNVLLSSDIGAEEKENILSEQYGIESTIKMEKEMRLMCNLSDLVEERATERGMAKGMAQGLTQGLTQGKAMMLVDIVDNFMVKNNVSFEKALDMLSVTKEEYDEAKELTDKSNGRYYQYLPLDINAWSV